MGHLKIILIAFFLPFYGNAQAPFFKMYAGNGFDRGESVVQLEDSSFIVAGTSGSWGGSSQIFLMSVDSVGNYKWSKQYGGEESEEGRRVLYNKDLGLYVAGTSNSYGQGDFDAYLFRTDKNGVFQWHKTYGLPTHWEKVNDAVMTADSGMVMVGERMALSGGNVDWYLLRTDKNGDTLWTKSWGGSGEDRANAIIEKDGNYWIGGEAYIAQNDIVRGIILRINDNGEIISGDTLNDLNRKYAITSLSKGLDRIYFCGYRELSSGVFDAYTGSIDFNGNLISHYTVANNANQDIFDQIIYQPYSNLVLISYRSKNPGTFQDDFDNFFAFHDPDNIFWLNNFRSMNNEGRDITNQMITTVEGGILAVGYNTHTGLANFSVNGGSNVFLFKINAQNQFPETQNIFDLNQLVSANQKEMQTVKVYPNPTKDFLTIETDLAVSQLALFDLKGQLLLSREIYGFEKLDLSQLSSGIYHLRIAGNHLKVVKD